MRKVAARMTSVVAILVFSLGSTHLCAQTLQQLKKENEALKALIGPPPSSLDNLYPPKAEQPIYLFKMYEMAYPFVGIGVDLFENDGQNVVADFEKFKAVYLEASKLVPEWEKDFPLTPVEELGAALKSGDQGKVMTAFEDVGEICEKCHISNMTKVRYKYHWKDFETIKVQDPLTKEQVDFSQFMQFLDGNFVGIAIDLQQGQKENAQKQFQGFKSRFQAMKQSCKDCHDDVKNDERKYFVDANVQTMIDALGQALEAEAVDPKRVETLSQGIGMESCFKCHMIHVPPQLAKEQWEPLEKER